MRTIAAQRRAQDIGARAGGARAEIQQVLDQLAVAVLRVRFPAGQDAALQQDQQAIAVAVAIWVDQRPAQQALRRATDRQAHQLLPVVQIVDGDDVDLLVFGANGQSRRAEHALGQEAQRRDALAKQVLRHQAQRLAVDGEQLNLAGGGADGQQIAGLIQRPTAGPNRRRRRDRRASGPPQRNARSGDMQRAAAVGADREQLAGQRLCPHLAIDDLDGKHQGSAALAGRGHAQDQGLATAGIDLEADRLGAGAAAARLGPQVDAAIGTQHIKEDAGVAALIDTDDHRRGHHAALLPQAAHLDEAHRTAGRQAHRRAGSSLLPGPGLAARAALRGLRRRGIQAGAAGPSTRRGQAHTVGFTRR